MKRARAYQVIFELIREQVVSLEAATWLQAHYVDWNKIRKQQILLSISGSNKTLNDLSHVKQPDFVFLERSVRPSVPLGSVSKTF